MTQMMTDTQMMVAHLFGEVVVTVRLPALDTIVQTKLTQMPNPAKLMGLEVVAVAITEVIRLPVLQVNPVL